uniref:Uncharacterized protein n=1 Tax=Gasterosteus aculeatus TaxID=69293 RepID=G3PM70_GASAC
KTTEFVNKTSLRKTNLLLVFLTCLRRSARVAVKRRRQVSCGRMNECLWSDGRCLLSTPVWGR